MKLSIVIPTYNNSHYLSVLLTNLLSSQSSDFEIIIIDDGSTDDTKQMIKEVRDKRIKYHFQKNAGQSSARNKGLEIANGEYIAFIDSDDNVEKKYVDVILSKIENYDVLVYSYAIGDIKKILKDKSGEGSYIFQINIAMRNFITWPVWNIVVKKEIINKFNFEIGMYGEDYLYNMYIDNKRENYKIIPDVLYYYNITNSESSLSTKNGKIKGYKDWIYLYKKNPVKFRNLEQLLIKIYLYTYYIWIKLQKRG